MVDLEALKSSGDDTGELGNNHEMDPTNRQRQIFWLIVIDFHVNLNIITL